MTSSTMYFASDGDFEDREYLDSSLLGAGTTRQRRIGGNHAYRDDPKAPPSHSFSSPLETPKDNLPLYKRCYNSCLSCTRWVGCSSYSMIQQEGPEGLYYRDDFNDSSWSCRPGTTDEHGIWINTGDQAGTIMACLVWVLLVYSEVTVTFLAVTGGIPSALSMLYAILISLALASHAKTTLTDPGAVPISAVPTEWQRKHAKLSMCSQCQTFKPPQSHHCRICNRCISRMDHHCPWMNNCIGAGNMKHFLLFLIYTWTCSVFSLLLLGWNYFFCDSEECMFHPVLTQLVRIMTLLSVGAFLFTSSMLMNVCYGIMTGVGTIDRLKKKATNTILESDEEPIPLTHVFGIEGYHTWPFPVDPVFEDYDRVMGYSTPQRLLREQMKSTSSRQDEMSVGEYYTPV
jgi:palmitoyltransferase ZDHHC3/7/25